MFGVHTGYIVASYGTVALILSGLLVTSLMSRANASQRLKRLEEDQSQ